MNERTGWLSATMKLVSAFFVSTPESYGYRADDNSSTRWTVFCISTIFLAVSLDESNEPGKSGWSGLETYRDSETNLSRRARGANRASLTSTNGPKRHEETFTRIGNISSGRDRYTLRELLLEATTRYDTNSIRTRTKLPGVCKTNTRMCSRRDATRRSNVTREIGREILFI